MYLKMGVIQWFVWWQDLIFRQVSSLTFSGVLAL